MNFKGSVQIEKSSLISLEGKSNIQGFRCFCKEPVFDLEFKASEVKQSNEIVFKDVKLNLPTSKIDCGNRKMNKEMVKALRADTYPDIEFLLKKIKIPEEQVFPEKGKSLMVFVEAIMKIGGISRKRNLMAKCKNINGNHYQIVAQHPFLLSDFSIKAPKVMMGLVKVEDRVILHLDLSVQLMLFRE